METPKFAVACPGEPCPLHKNPDSHSHMPFQPLQGENPNLGITDPESLSVISEILASYDSLTGEQRTLDLHEHEFGTLGMHTMVELEKVGA